MRPHVRASPAACGGNRGDHGDERRPRADLDAPSEDRRGEFVRRWSCLAVREGRYACRYRGGGGGGAGDGPRGGMSLGREERVEAVANFYRVVDLYGIGRSIVHSAMSLFDVVCSRGLITSDQTQSALLTCFWMSFKLNSTTGHIFSSAQFGHVVGSSIDACHLEGLEMIICTGMEWRLNPPTPSSYVELVDPLLEEVFGSGGLAPLRKEILALAYHLIDLSLPCLGFVGRRPSSVAAAALLASMEMVRLPPSAADWFRSLPLGLEDGTNDEYECLALFGCLVECNRLRPQVVLRGGGESDGATSEKKAKKKKEKKKKGRGRRVSPKKCRPKKCWQ